MKLQYLGTAAAEGWPGLFCNCKQCETARILGRKNIRTRSQAVLYTNAVGSGGVEDILLIDLPPDTYLHCLHHGLRLDRIGHLLITHSHFDHFSPAELTYRSGVYANPAPSFPLNVYGNETVREVYQRVAGCDGVKYHVVENFRPFEAGKFTVTALLATHDRTERCLIYMIEHEGKRMLYGNDTGIFPEETWQYISGKPFDLVSLDCTHGINKEGNNHMGIPDVLEVKRRMEILGCLKAGKSGGAGSKVVLNHFSHNDGPYYDAMLDVAADYSLEVSYDGGVWDI